jgi:hypothetical protein
MVWSYIVPDDKKEFVEIPTLTMSPIRKKGFPRPMIIIGALIMLIALAIIVLAVMGMGG